jgi:peptidoglycan/LPS O-acetylase OafA/YrhL
MQRRRFLVLDGLRGIAAVAVMALHVSKIHGVTDIPNAYLAVDFFFLLSGLVLAHAYGAQLAQGGASFWTFLRARAVRLIPLAILGTLIGAVASESAGQEKLAALALNSVFLPTPLSGTPFVFLNPPTWSLLFEVLVNVAYAVIAPRLTTHRLVVMTVLFGGATIWMATVNRGLDVGYTGQTLPWGVVRVLFPFSCGVLLQRFPARGGVSLWPLLLALMVPLLWPLPLRLWSCAAVLVIFPLIVALGASGRAAAASADALGYFGRISYPLYVLHYPIAVLALKAANAFGAAGAVSAGVTILFSLVAAHVALKFYDEPVRAWLNRRRPAPASVSA